MAPNQKSDGGRGYKRSWRNLLLNKRYQLRFTLFMVGLSAVLIGALGWWVMRVATEATTVASGQLAPCPKLPDYSDVLSRTKPPTTPMKLPDIDDGAAAGEGDGSGSAADTAAGSGSGSGSAADTAAGSGSDAGSGSAAGSGSDAGSGSADGDDSPRHRVHIEVSSMQLSPVIPDNFAQRVVQHATHWTCEVDRAHQVADLEHGRNVILYVLIAVGTVLVLALAFLGLKTTHKVAGPLHKVTLYFAKMREGRFDKVWPLRKGDQLVAFYEHFRAAHSGLVKLEEADIERLRAVLEAAEHAGLAGKSPEIDEALAELRAMLERKEKSLG